MSAVRYHLNSVLMDWSRKDAFPTTHRWRYATIDIAFFGMNALQWSAIRFIPEILNVCKG